jgi:adenylylsulfate kinase
MARKILIVGLPGAGKTTLALALAPRLNAVHFNGDEVRGALNRDLGFSHEDRIEQARRMGWLTDQVVKAGGNAIADFVCPTAETRAAFEAGGRAYVIWIDRITSGRFEDTNRMFDPPNVVDFRIPPEGTPDYWVEQVVRRIQPVFDPKRPTALFVGRFQPFHAGHRQLIVEGLKQVGQACIGVRDVEDAGTLPLGFEDVKLRIERSMQDHAGLFTVIPLPNVTSVLYASEAGYEVRQIQLDSACEIISEMMTSQERPSKLGKPGGSPRSEWL